MNDKPSTERYIGLMSGTSADGVDAALVEIDAQQIRLIDFIDTPMPVELKTRLIDLNQNPQLSLSDLSKLEFQVAIEFISATQKLLLQANLSKQDIRAIGSHGQTVFHAPEIPMSLQIGHPAFIAKQTGIDTVADFRIDDLAVGGQGAPLAPAFHQHLFKPQSACCVINIGGIANISYLNPNSGEVYGFDCGPGNALMDELCLQEFGCDYDRNGEIAASTQSNANLLKQLLLHPYLHQPFPKSTGRETFHYPWFAEQAVLVGENMSPAEQMATLNAFTATSIALGVRQLKIAPCDIWVVGGGAFNPTLLNNIQNQLPDFNIRSSEEIDINPNAIEAMMCAWLAHQRIHQKPVALKSITGSQRDVTLGGLWLAN
ncbi:MAG: anhydro-N-acetylmuramic acid kinase [Thiomicrorhabdus chilensis]|uniref:anhydro-N-acetylmuramic acid kinase n=1 Tax=Thiomicrorhabdus chilensis TaxID=63656 RepID=UPI00299F3DEA|nr:anhydro-N-acetylmuramic acid kinase [Thiomicrorhabdus chilensis]MDX1347146.1 anhydro-N-acetylmuramic acid kinase [Thiomicrorhabdus chilensis]